MGSTPNTLANNLMNFSCKICYQNTEERRSIRVTGRLGAKEGPTCETPFTPRHPLHINPSRNKKTLHRDSAASRGARMPRCCFLPFPPIAKQASSSSPILSAAAHSSKVLRLRAPRRHKQHACPVTSICGSSTSRPWRHTPCAADTTSRPVLLTKALCSFTSQSVVASRSRQRSKRTERWRRTLSNRVHHVSQHRTPTSARQERRPR